MLEQSAFLTQINPTELAKKCLRHCEDAQARYVPIIKEYEANRIEYIKALKTYHESLEEVQSETIQGKNRGVC